MVYCWVSLVAQPNLLTSDWQGWAYGRPFGWGNRTDYPSGVADMFAINLQAMFIYRSGENPFYMPSGCAYNNWNTLGGSTLCPSVR